MYQAAVNPASRVRCPNILHCSSLVDGVVTLSARTGSVTGNTAVEEGDKSLRAEAVEVDPFPAIGEAITEQ